MSSVKIYFDTHIFADLYQKRQPYTNLDLAPLYEVIEKRRASIILSTRNIEEILPMLKSNSDKGWNQLKNLLNLTSWNDIVKPQNEVVADDIKSYAATGLSTNPFIQDQERLQNIKRGISNLLLSPSESNKKILLNYVTQDDTLTERSKKVADAALKAIRQIFNDPKKTEEEKKEIKAAYKKMPLIENSGWIGIAERLATAFAEKCGVKYDCEKRGFAGLLQIKSVRMSIWQTLALFYSQLFERHNPEPSDRKDIQHSILAAAAADIFVTHDGHLKETAKAVSINGLEILGLPELLNLLVSKGG